MKVDIDDMERPFSNAFTALKTKYPGAEFFPPTAWMWWKNYGVKLHWQGGCLKQLEFKSKKHYLMFVLRWV
jgi:hypothetical protein